MATKKKGHFYNLPGASEETQQSLSATVNSPDRPLPTSFPAARGSGAQPRRPREQALGGAPPANRPASGTDAPPGTASTPPAPRRPDPRDNKRHRTLPEKVGIHRAGRPERKTRSVEERAQPLCTGRGAGGERLPPADHQPHARARNRHGASTPSAGKTAHQVRVQLRMRPIACDIVASCPPCRPLGEV